MGVGFLILLLYAGLGVMGLVAFAALGLLDVKLLFFLFVFYVLAYFTIGALMAAIGSAVNEMREAQTLMMPDMMMILTAWIFWWYIAGDPNSTFATITSFIPPISNFVMLIRMTSTSPPPMWQAFLSIAIGAAGVYAALWFASKVFRIGLLMFPRRLRHADKWARMFQRTREKRGER
jgi:ABC-2 type transport system permease protein